MTTYNDLLSRFAIKCYPTQITKTINSIKATFKRLTTIPINEEVTDYNIQLVIDCLSNAKIPHCTFADWLRKAHEKPATPVVATVLLEPKEVEQVEAEAAQPTSETTIAEMFERAYTGSFIGECVPECREFCNQTGLKPWMGVSKILMKHLNLLPERARIYFKQRIGLYRSTFTGK